jgi:hypothetical protein
MLYLYMGVGERDEDGHLSCCDEDVLHSPLRCCAALPTSLLFAAVALSPLFLAAALLLLLCRRPAVILYVYVRDNEGK